MAHSIKSTPSHDDLVDQDGGQAELAIQTKMTSSLSLYTLNCALVASVGSLLYGIDSGIISTTISHESYLSYFAPYSGKSPFLVHISTPLMSYAQRTLPVLLYQHLERVASLVCFSPAGLPTSGEGRGL